ncbi:hypothetical protein Hanom_Chr06g00493071 [Helianthus anomalus]
MPTANRNSKRLVFDFLSRIVFVVPQTLIASHITLNRICYAIQFSGCIWFLTCNTP